MVALLTFLAGPIGRWLLIAAIACAAVAGTYFRIKSIGWEERDALAQKEALEQAQQAAARAKARQAVTERVVIRYRDRIQVVHQQGEEVVREVEKLVPVGSCDLPGGWRVLHDAAASGSFPSAAARIDAAPVDAQTAARTVAGNYSACREDGERLKALQDWVLEQSKVR